MAKPKGMSQAERDELQVEQVALLDRVAGALERAVATRAEQVEREVVALKGLRQAPFFAGEAGLRVQLAAIPQLAELWMGEGSVEVPAANVAGVVDVGTRKESPMVLCRCGKPTVLTPFRAESCGGDCGRWFLALPSGVRVRKFDQESEAA